MNLPRQSVLTPEVSILSTRPHLQRPRCTSRAQHCTRQGGNPLLSRPSERCSRCRTRCQTRPQQKNSSSGYILEDLNQGVHRVLKENYHRFRRIEADENVWDRTPVADCEGQAEGAADEAREDVGIPVFVMLPLDTIKVTTDAEGVTHSRITNEMALELALHTIREAGVTGVMVDVWWGICERDSPGKYDFSAYRKLFHKIAATGLKIQAVMSFHTAGGNVGDTCHVPLPRWVHDVGRANPDVYYTDRAGHRNEECLSIGCDYERLFHGRSPLEMYAGMMSAFADKFQHLFGDVLVEITIGCGPAGELRYPSYPEATNLWRFPGVGEFQCYDAYMLADLSRWAEVSGKPQWGLSGPHDAGHYCARAEHTGFFHPDGAWNTPYGHFFLDWYSGMLRGHAEELLNMMHSILMEPGRPRRLKSVQKEGSALATFEFQSPVCLGIKLAGVHWQYRTPSHGAELTAGYWNTSGRNGYEEVFHLVHDFGGNISFTCVEMRDCEHHPDAQCSPEGLLNQIFECSEQYGVPLTGENALQRYDEHGLRQIREGALAGGAPLRSRLSQLTFLRMGDSMFDHWTPFKDLVSQMATLEPHVSPHSLACDGPARDGASGATPGGSPPQGRSTRAGA